MCECIICSSKDLPVAEKRARYELALYVEQCRPWSKQKKYEIEEWVELIAELELEEVSE